MTKVMSSCKNQLASHIWSYCTHYLIVLPLIFYFIANMHTYISAADVNQVAAWSVEIDNGDSEKAKKGKKIKTSTSP
jgi:hypothetical protein